MSLTSVRTGSREGVGWMRYICDAVDRAACMRTLQRTEVPGVSTRDRSHVRSRDAVVRSAANMLELDGQAGGVCGAWYYRHRPCE